MATTTKDFIRYHFDTLIQSQKRVYVQLSICDINIHSDKLIVLSNNRAKNLYHIGMYDSDNDVMYNKDNDDYTKILTLDLDKLNTENCIISHSENRIMFIKFGVIHITFIKH